MKVFSASWHNNRLYLTKEDEKSKHTCVVIPHNKNYEVIYDDKNFICQIKVK